MCVGICPQSLSSLTESLVKSGFKDANDLDTFRRLKTVFTKIGMELYDLSIFTTLSLHFAYQEFK